MKKNKMMRIASVLLVAVLLSTCAISGTFAKYTTSDDAQDSARVAKWGVVLSVSDTNGSTLFSKDYEGTANKITVSSALDDLVAPGTENAEGITFTINGTPEVATKVEFDLGDVKDVFLMYDADGNSENGKETPYNPVKFTLVHTYGTGSYSIAQAFENTGAVVDTTTPNQDEITGTLQQIDAGLTALTNEMTHQNPGYVYADTFKLTWAWDFDDNGSETYDELDTQLGDLAAADPYAEEVAGEFCLKVAFNFSITIEQVN